MYNSDCPGWLCNEWGVPHDYVYFLIFLVLVIPYFLIWRKVYKAIAPDITSVLHYSVLALGTLFTLCIYLGLIGALGSGVPRVGSLLLAISYVVTIVSVFPAVFLGAAIVVLVIVSAFKKDTGDVE